MGLKSDQSVPSNDHARRMAWLISLIGFGSFLSTAIGYAVFGVLANVQPLYVSVLLQLFNLIVWAYSLFTLRKENSLRGYEFALGALVLTAPLNTLIFSGLGWVIGLSTVLGVAAGAGLVLAPARTQRWIIAAVVSGVASFLLDTFGSPERLNLQFPNTYAIAIVGVVILLLLVLIAFRFRNFSLRTKLITVFVGLAVLSIVSITFVAAQAIRNSLTTNAARDLRTRAQSAALAIGITMDRNVDRLQTLSLSKGIQNDVTLISNSYPPTTEGRVKWIADKTAQWAGANPQEVVIQSALNGQLAYSLRQFSDIFQGNKELFMTDEYGSVVAATDWRPSYNYSQDPWWQIAYSGGRGGVYIGQPEFNPMINEYGVRIALPIFAPGRTRVVGVIHTIYTLTALQRALLLNSFGQTGKVDLLFPQGQILTSDGTFRALTTEEFTEIKDGISNPLATLTYRGTPLLSSQGVVGVSDEQPEPYLRSSAWRTIATIQEEEALGAVEAGAQAALTAGAVTIGIAVLIALLMAQLLTRPIRRLTAVAEEIQSGDLSARAPVETGDEIGTLARTFNGMTARLQETLSGLEHRVAERTQELSEANLILQSNSAYLSALSDTSSGLFERLNLNELLQAILERAGALVGTQNGFVFFSEPGDNEIQMRVGSGLYDDLVGTRAQEGVGLAGSVWQTGEPMIIEDYQKWEGRLPGSRRDALRAIVAVPLKRGRGTGSADDETVGVIGLAYTEQGRSFGKTEVEILQRFAQLASIALDNADLYANSENRVQELAALNSISQLVVQQGDFQSVVERVGDEIRRIFDADFGYFALYNPETQHIDFPYVVDDGKRIQIQSLTLGEGITSHIISTGETVLLAHATASDYERIGAIDSGDGSSPHSLLAVPIRAGDQVIGALSVQRVAADRPFTNNDAELLTTIATNVGVGIENIRLAQATQLRVRELSAVNRVGAILNTAQDFNERLRQVGFEVANTFQVSSLYIALYDAAHDLIEMPFFIEEGVQEQIAPRPRGTGLVAHMVTTRETLLINHNMMERFQELGGVWIGNAGLQTQSYLGVPLVAGDEALGAIALNALEEGRFTDSDVKFLQTIAGVISSGIQNERLAQDTQRRLAELAALNKISSILTADRALTTRLAEVGRELHTIFGVSSVYLALYDAMTNIVRMPFFRGDDQEYVIEPFEMGPGFTSHIIQTRQPLRINDNIEEAMRSLQAMNAGKGDVTQSYLGVPMLLSDQVLGVIGLSAEPKNKFQDSDVRLLETIASAVATAIQNTRLLEQTLERAREMDAINSLAREITQQRSLDDLFQEVYLQVKSVSSADGLLISLYDDRTDTISVPFLMDEGRRYEITPDALLMEREFSDQVRMGDPVVVNSTPEQVAELEKSPAVAGGGRASRSRLYVPLMAGIRFLGMISLHSYEYNAYTQRDVSVLTGLASHIAVALENARLFEQTQQALAETNRLYRIAEAANTETDEQAFYRRIHEIVGETMSAKNMLIALFNGEDNTMDMVYFVDEQDVLPEMPLRRINVGTGITAYVLRTRQPLLATKEDIRNLADKGELKLHGGHSEMWLGVPMMRGEQPLGVIAVQTYDPNIRYTERDKQTLTNISQGVANAIERRRAEAALRLSEERLADALRATHLGNWEYDFVNDVFTFNDAFYEMMRTSAKREGGYIMSSMQYATRFVYPDDAAMVGAEVQAAAVTTDPNFTRQLDHRVIFGDGSIGYVSVNFRIEKDASGRTVRSFGANLDVTERKRNEVELQAALAETQRLAEQARVAAEQVTALNRRLTREGWREYLDQLNTPMLVQAGEELESEGTNRSNGDAPNGNGVSAPETVRVPIELRGVVIGEIELEYEDASSGWTENQQAIVDDVAERLGIVLDNARLFQQSQAALDETRRLAEREKRAAEIADRLYGATDVKAILRIATEELRKTTGSARAVVKLNREKSNLS